MKSQQSLVHASYVAGTAKLLLSARAEQVRIFFFFLFKKTKTKQQPFSSSSEMQLSEQGRDSAEQSISLLVPPRTEVGDVDPSSKLSFFIGEKGSETGGKRGGKKKKKP